ncbi:hypothetical protein Dda_3304 [Drechslerella dactyloides]|uniref:Molybdenum cofactor sulfurase n=1 Tax=Drechslerella dactyloides TaxID=74499 RepID=A0AAD6NL40_DREDA|nr:hypothetical protein Dda_3304 [Drechslerella dactyloides]
METKSKLAIAVDFGTTYSGIAYMPVGENEQFSQIDHWPGAPGKLYKVPTVVSYSFDANTNQWHPHAFGFAAELDHAEQRCSLFKMFLETDEGESKPQRRSQTVQNSRTTVRPTWVELGKKVNQVIKDFLGLMYEHMLATFQDEGLRPEDVEYDVLFTVPALFEVFEVQKFKTLVQATGFGRHTFSVSLREPEAAILYTINHGIKRLMPAGQCIVLCDAGGGTVDIASYKVVEHMPRPKIEQVNIVSGRPCGSITIDEAFKKYLFDKCLNESHAEFLQRPQGRRDLNRMCKHFSDRKETFDDGPSTPKITVRTSPPDLEGFGIQGGFIHIPREKMRDLFEESVNGTLDCLREHLVECARQGLSVKSIFLVGGLGSSKYLHQRIKEYTSSLSGGEIEVIKPRDAEFAVIRGAIESHQQFLLGKEDSITLRVCPASYGVRVCEEWNPAKHDVSYDRRFTQPTTGKLMAKNQIDWLIKKGDKIQGSRVADITKSFLRHFEGSPEIWQDQIVMCTLDDPPTRMTTAVKPACMLRSDMTGLPIDMFDKHKSSEKSVSFLGIPGMRRKTYYNCNFNIVMKIGLTDIEFQMWFKERLRSELLKTSWGRTTAPETRAVQPDREYYRQPEWEYYFRYGRAVIAFRPGAFASWSNVNSVRERGWDVGYEFASRHDHGRSQQNHIRASTFVFAYELPVECVSVKCPQDDIVQERLWRETVCTGFTTTTILTFSSWVETQTSTTTASAAATGTQICQEGWRGCPRALNGGCCPSDNFCNIQDCYPSPTTSTLGLTKILSPSEVPPVDISNVFPPCSHQCLAKYLPRTKCGTSPLNQTCFCQLHDFFSCLSPCSISEVEAFTAAHLEICKPLLYLTPYDTSDRWCDLKDGGGKEGKPFGYDTRMGNLENRCPDWWGQRSPGKRFGIILGITILIAFTAAGRSTQIHTRDSTPSPKSPEMSDDTRHIATLQEDLERIERAFPGSKYNAKVEEFRQKEYPQLNGVTPTGVTYLDHAATTLYSSTLIDTVSADLKSNLFGNPHSLCPSSQATTRRIEDTRVRVLQLFNADPEHFDIVFCANATAAIKIVADAFTAHAEKNGRKLEYRVHEDAHTSLVGIRPMAGGSLALGSREMYDFVASKAPRGEFGLMAYPAQSNMSGRRHPLYWADLLRRNRPGWYTLLDAAALVTTSPLDLSDHNAAPDFVALSFYKMFGYPDLGGLIVRKESSSVLESRQYFGGGTLSFVMNPRSHPSKHTPHAIRKAGDPHEYLEDGTVPFHSIIALDHALSDHRRLYGSFKVISQHTQALGILLYDGLRARKHPNGRRVVDIYTGQHPSLPQLQGATLAINFRRSDGSFVGFNDVLKLAAVRNIHLRTGGLCNPGGVMRWMELSESDMQKNFAAGKRCGDEWDLMDGRPTGAVRISLGAMSTLEDVSTFLSFVDEFYVEKHIPITSAPSLLPPRHTAKVSRISIYPIKSCAPFNIPTSQLWKVMTQGLEYDREFCLIHQGTGRVMDMKIYPKMALIRPVITPEKQVLSIYQKGLPVTTVLQIPLKEHLPTNSHHITKKCDSKVCGDTVVVQAYSEERISGWFSSALGVPCTLARYPSKPDGGGRYMKNHLRQKHGQIPIALRNESPILVTNQRSLEPINKVISAHGGKEADISVFRSNIVIDGPQPFDEDRWLQIGFRDASLQVLGPCRRCHMICIDQETSERSPEPFATLSKLRSINGKVFFGQHGTFLGGPDRETGFIQVGDELDITYVAPDPESSDTESGESYSTDHTNTTAASIPSDVIAESPKTPSSCVIS